MSEEINTITQNLNLSVELIKSYNMRPIPEFGFDIEGVNTKDCEYEQYTYLGEIYADKIKAKDILIFYKKILKGEYATIELDGYDYTQLIVCPTENELIRFTVRADAMDDPITICFDVLIDKKIFINKLKTGIRIIANEYKKYFENPEEYKYPEIEW